MNIESSHNRHVHIAAVSGACLHRLPELLQSWLPDGRALGGEWVALNPTRTDRRAGSFKINMTTGRWADFATHDAGGDVVSLYAYLNGLSQVVAYSGVIRPPVPIVSGHPYRFDPAGDSGASGHPHFDTV